MTLSWNLLTWYPKLISERRKEVTSGRIQEYGPVGGNYFSVIERVIVRRERRWWARDDVCESKLILGPGVLMTALTSLRLSLQYISILYFISSQSEIIPSWKQNTPTWQADPRQTSVKLLDKLTTHNCSTIRWLSGVSINKAFTENTDIFYQHRTYRHRPNELSTFWKLFAGLIKIMEIVASFIYLKKISWIFPLTSHETSSSNIL